MKNIRNLIKLMKKNTNKNNKKNRRKSNRGKLAKEYQKRHGRGIVWYCSVKRLRRGDGLKPLTRSGNGCSKGYSKLPLDSMNDNLEFREHMSDEQPGTKSIDGNS